MGSAYCNYCKIKIITRGSVLDDTVVKWSFEGIERPIGVAEYENELKKLIEGLAQNS